MKNWTGAKEMFAPLVGEYIWNVTCGFGNKLTLEFGEPHLTVREPVKIDKAVSEASKRLLSRRQIWLHGKWHLWVEVSSWIAEAQGLICRGETDDTLFSAIANELNGQELTAFREMPGETFMQHVLEFDLGGKLTIYWDLRPKDPSEDVYSLWEHNSNCFGVSYDGHVHLVSPSTY